MSPTSFYVILEQLPPPRSPGSPPSPLPLPHSSSSSRSSGTSAPRRSCPIMCVSRYPSSLGSTSDVVSLTTFVFPVTTAAFGTTRDSWGASAGGAGAGGGGTRGGGTGVGGASLWGC
ncbi:unnamed protein product [Closterium sp. NIES-54]